MKGKPSYTDVKDSNLHCNELSELSLSLNRSYFFNTSPSVGRKERMQTPTHTAPQQRSRINSSCFVSKANSQEGRGPTQFGGSWLQEHQNHQHDQGMEAHTVLFCTFACCLNTLTCTNSPLRIKPYFCPLYSSLG